MTPYFTSRQVYLARKGQSALCGLAFLSCIVENCRWRKLKIFNFLLKNFPVWHGGKRDFILCAVIPERAAEKSPALGLLARPHGRGDSGKNGGKCLDGINLRQRAFWAVRDYYGEKPTGNAFNSGADPPETARHFHVENGLCCFHTGRYKAVYACFGQNKKHASMRG